MNVGHDLWYDRDMQTSQPVPTPCLLLTAKALNERASATMDVIRRSCIALRDEDAVSFRAAELGVAHLGDVERLERLAARAQAVIDSKNQL